MLLYIITRERTDCHGGRGDRLGQGGKRKDRDRLIYAGRNRGVNYRNALAPRFTGCRGIWIKKQLEGPAPTPGSPAATTARMPAGTLARTRTDKKAARPKGKRSRDDKPGQERVPTYCMPSTAEPPGCPKNKYHLVREKCPKAYLTDVRWRRSSIHIPDLYFLPPSSASSAVTAVRSFRSRPAGNDQYPYLPWGELGS